MSEPPARAHRARDRTRPDPAPGEGRRGPPRARRARESVAKYATAADRAAWRKRRFTLEEFERLPESDVYRYELVRGRLVREPGPAELHGFVQARLTHFLLEYVEREHLGIVVTDADYVLVEEEPATVLRPDLAFVAAARLEGGRPAEKARRGPPDLAVEIVSPSNRASTMHRKVLYYLDTGVREVWVVDPGARTVTVYRPGGEARVFRRDQDLEASSVLPEFRLPLTRLFG